MLRILFRDEHFIAIDKPSGLLVHRSRLAPDKDVVLQRLRDQIDQHVFPVHRLDRKTSGVLIFGLSSDSAKLLAEKFKNHEVRKSYLAIVRGHTEMEGIIDSALTNENEKTQDAETHFRRLAKTELEIPVDRYENVRYSLIEVSPKTGRYRQIRKHFAHLRHPILGDRKHGDRHHNRMWREQFDMDSMMLLSWKLRIEHPVSKEILELTAQPEAEMERVMGILGFNLNA